MKILVALRDAKTGAFYSPMCCTNESEAARTYGDLLEKGPELITKHPADFPLYEVGKYDEQTGEVFPLFNQNGNVAPPRLLIDAGQVLQLVKDERSDAVAERVSAERRA